MWDPCTHTDDMLETVLINVAYMYLSGLKTILRPDILHHTAILPEKGKLLIMYIFAKAILKWWTFLFHFICWYLYAYVCGGQRTVSGVFLNSSPHWFSGRISHWTWRLPIWIWLQCPQIVLLSTEITGMYYPQLWTQVLMLMWKVLYHKTKQSLQLSYLKTSWQNQSLWELKIKYSVPVVTWTLLHGIRRTRLREMTQSRREKACGCP